MFIIEGCIQALRKANGTLNLVADIQNGGLFTGLAAGLAGQSTMLANSASLALYDGEDVEHIALLINNKLAIGTFEWLGDIEIGDDVKLVVREMEDGLLFLHAILRKDDQFLWLPHSISRTRHGWKMYGVKFFSFLVLTSLFLFFTYFAIRSAPFPDPQDILTLTSVALLLNSFVVLMTIRGMSSMGKHAENIFSSLGVPEFEKFNIGPFSLIRTHSIKDPDFLKKSFIFEFDKALKNHKKKYRLPD